jgi:ankyrin repeat protein
MSSQFMLSAMSNTVPDPDAMVRDAANPDTFTQRQVPKIETLPTELMDEIIRLLHPVDFFALRLAGSGFINRVVLRHCTAIPFRKYVAALEEETYRRGAWKTENGSALHLAAARGHISLMAALLHRPKRCAGGVKNPIPIQTHGYLFHHFDPKDLRRLIDQKSAIHLAAEFGRDDAVQMLLDLGAHPAARMNRGSSRFEGSIPSCVTPIHLATANNHQSTVRLLLNQVTTSQSDLQDLLSWAAHAGHVDMVRFLIGEGAITPSNAVIAAAEAGHQSTLAVLLDEKSPMDIGPKDLNVVFSRVSASGDIQSGRKLLSLGANVQYKDKDCSMPLDIALTNGHASMAEMLLQQGAATEFHPRTLSLAAAAGHDACVHVLLEHGAPSDGDFPRAGEYLARNFSDNLGKGFYPALHEAVGSGQLSVTSILLAHGANVNGPTARALIPLHFAVGAKSPFDVRAAVLLLDAGARIDAQTDDKLTTLHLSCERGNHGLVKLLLARGANPDAKDNRGRAPLHYAAEDNHCAIIQELVEAGCNVNIQDAYGDTPLHLCGRPQASDAFWILRYRGADETLQNDRFEVPEIRKMWAMYDPNAYAAGNPQSSVSRPKVSVYPIIGKVGYISKAFNPRSFADLYQGSYRRKEFGFLIKEKDPINPS